MFKKLGRWIDQLILKIFSSTNKEDNDTYTRHLGIAPPTNSGKPNIEMVGESKKNELNIKGNFTNCPTPEILANQYKIPIEMFPKSFDQGTEAKRSDDELGVTILPRPKIVLADLDEADRHARLKEIAQVLSAPTERLEEVAKKSLGATPRINSNPNKKKVMRKKKGKKK